MYDHELKFKSVICLLFYDLVFSFLLLFVPWDACADPEGGSGGLDPTPENLQSYRFLSNIGPDPLKITKLPSQRSISGHHRPASEMSLQWRDDDGPSSVVFDIFGSSPLINQKKNCQSWTPSIKTFWISAYDGQEL